MTEQELDDNFNMGTSPINLNPVSVSPIFARGAHSRNTMQRPAYVAKSWSTKATLGTSLEDEDLKEEELTFLVFEE